MIARKVCLFAALLPTYLMASLIHNPSPVKNLENVKTSRSFLKIVHDELGGSSNASLLALELHNDIRKDHQAPPLKLCPQLQKAAQSHAEKMFASGLNNVTYSTTNQNVFYTVNGTFGVRNTETTTIFFAIISWYDAEFNYNYEDPVPLADSFTRIVWKSTTELGIGYVIDKDNKLGVVVANYGPSGGPDLSNGNVADYKENISKPIDS